MTDDHVLDQGERYDRIADGYGTWWGPVLEPAALELLDFVAPDAATARRVVDVGTGTGTVALAAARRWPSLEVVGVDASEAMLAAARRAAEAARVPEGQPGVTFTRAYADRLPLDDASADLVLSSFVYQLVPSRGRALREAHRILAPGGRLAYVTWLEGATPFAPDAAFDDALEAVGLDPRGDADDDGRAGDVPTPGAAAAQARRAGFRSVAAHAGAVRHDFTPESWLGFLAEFDEQDLFASLDRDLRGRLEEELLHRLRALAPADLRLELPVVYVTGRRSGPAG